MDSMNNIMSLQNLAVTVNGLKEYIELDTTRVQATMNSNNPNCSEYHARFAQLLRKFSAFAVQYKFDLESLHKSLTNNITIQQKEQERALQEKLETLTTLSEKSSHSNNLEIVENVQETGYSSTNSLMIPHSPSQQQQIVSSDPEQHESINVPSPKAIQSRKSVPTQNIQTHNIPTHNVATQNVPKKKNNKPQNKSPQKKSPPKKTNKPKRKKSPSPKPVRNNNNNNRNNNRNSNRNNNNGPQQTATPPPQAQPKTKPAPARVEEPTFERIITAEQEQKKEEQQQQNDDTPYVYNADKVNWYFDEKEGPSTSSTVVYIGNIPFTIKKKAIEFFVIKKAKVTARHIEEIKTKETRNGQFALVRFRYDVGIEKVQEFMDSVNSENATIKDEKKKAKDTVPMKKSNKKDDDNKKNKQEKKLKTSWQTRVFIKYQDPQYHYSYYETEEDMYNDQRATHALFVRNFDILDKNCHYELTKQLLKFGDLVKDIDIRFDRFDDPYLIVIFKYINDAIYCCNSDIYFKGRRLEIRYSKF